jgi:hypothetical protein
MTKGDSMTRLTDLALAALIGALAFQLAPRLAGPSFATEATFGGAATPVVSVYDETWEATEFLGHDPGVDADFKAAEGASRPFVTADFPQKFFDRNTPLKTRVVWRREEANSAQLSTLMVTKWRVTGHIHAQ